jgi:hypothetical protein
MTTDIAIPLDGKLTLTADAHQYRVPKPAPKPLPRKEAIAAQDARLRQLTAQGCIAIRGKTGATVFKFL